MAATLNRNTDWINVAKAAEIIGCTEGRVCQLLRSGEISGEKFNDRAWAVDRRAAEKYAALDIRTPRARISRGRASGIS